jgi:hypothetical protein
MYIRRVFLATKGASNKQAQKPRAEKLLLGLPYYNRYQIEDLE